MDEALEEAEDDAELPPEPAEEDAEEEADDEEASPPDPPHWLPLSSFPRGRTAAGEATTMGRRMARREKTPVSFIVKECMTSKDSRSIDGIERRLRKMKDKRACGLGCWINERDN